MNKPIIFTTAILLNAISAFAQSTENAVAQTQLVKEFTSPNNRIEKCIALAKLPLGDYKKKDQAEEQRLCSLDFYNNTVALCPKTWSTSPATIVHGLNASVTNSEQAEASYCKHGNSLKTHAKFKQTMNQSDTSGTFSAASILYYHFSRALDTDVKIPVAVYRTMDKDAHYARVTRKANPPSTATMNLAGWNWFRKAELSPQSYNQKADLFTKDQEQIYGVLLKDKGERYGAEINGTRRSGWGKGQNFDFQKTPAFLALKTPKDLETSIQEGFQQSIKDPYMKAAFPDGFSSKAEMVSWMNEISEVALLDFIFSQQDRVGNIDYQWNWVYLDEAGDLQSEKVDDDRYESMSRLNKNKIPVPANLVGKNPVLIQRTLIGDNDAGGLVEYANFSKSTGMLDGVAGVTNSIAHLSKDTYQRLLKLSRDFETRGENFKILDSEFRILGFTDSGDRRFKQMIGNTMMAAKLLENNCRKGFLKLDLVSLKKAMKNQFTTEPTNCEIEN